MANQEEITQRVAALVVDHLGVDAGEVKPEASFIDDLGADSLDIVELVMEDVIAAQRVYDDALN